MLLLVLLLDLATAVEVTIPSFKETNDFCDPDPDRCDEEGRYLYFAITSYSDFLIRDLLDADMDIIPLKPKVAAKRIKRTISAHPSSPRAHFNQLLLASNQKQGDEGLSIGHKLLSFPQDEMMPGLYTLACNNMLELAETTQNPLRSVLETTASCLQRPRHLSGSHKFWGKQVDAAVILGEWEMALRGLDGLVQEMEDKTEAGFMVGEVSLAMQVLRIAIHKILQGNKSSMECMKDKDKEMEKLREEVLKMRKEEARRLQAQKEKYDNLLLQARQDGRSEEELEPFYEVGIEVGFFLSRWQRPIDAVKDLRAQKIWSLDQLEKNLQLCVTRLQDNWEKVKEEGEALRSRVKWLAEVDLVENNGSWNQLHFMGPAVGKNGWPSKEEVCELAVITCDIVEDMLTANGNKSCQTCTAKWSILDPHTRVKPHCGPTNSRLRLHFGLKIPNEGCGMEVGGTQLNWAEGEVLIFDDSFEHSVWNDSEEERMIFILDVPHPDLTQEQGNRNMFRVEDDLEQVELPKGLRLE